MSITPATFVVLLREVTDELGIDIELIDDDGARLAYQGDTVNVSFSNLRPRMASADTEDAAREILRRFVSSVVSASELDDSRDAGIEVMGPRLMPRVGRPFESGVVPTGLPHHEMVPGLVQIHLVGDEPDLVWYVTDEHIERWGVDFYDALLRATRNLRERTTPETLAPVADMPHLFVSETGDTYDASRMLLLKELVQPWPDAGVVVSVPTRDVLLVTALNDPSALQSMHVMVGFAHELFQRDGYTISDQPLWYDGTKWEVLPVRFAEGVIEFHPPEGFVEVLARWQALSEDHAGGAATDSYPDPDAGNFQPPREWTPDGDDEDAN